MSASDAETAVAYLRSPLAIRARCENILEAGIAGSLAHFTVDLDALPRVIDEVVTVTRAQYPSLAIPVHGRMNHFRAAGVDRVAQLDTLLSQFPRDEQARCWIDLVVISVVLAGADGDEDFAAASYSAYLQGLFSSEPDTMPTRVDAATLRSLTSERLASALGVDDRIGLVHALAEALIAAPELFPGERPGGLIDHLQWIAIEKRAPGGSSIRKMVTKIDAPSILQPVLECLGSLWPGPITLGDHNLGDVWPHPAAGGTGASAGLVPFHGRSQWLAYSLFEPLQRGGLEITQPGALTGLPDLRNGGLLIDLGVLSPRHAEARTKVHAPGDELVVEWRALTIALLDRIAQGVRERLGKTPVELPLANILEGGTWAAGRAVAARLRDGGAPPINVDPASRAASTSR